ncbi:hypothetical protein ACJMK2_036709 [Sinanodonta woodiana]|uniref:G patch domain-containing protein 11 n=1 Tax=Sinanodonta woodiana TaxID=1069815 RepID=A0ABD3WLL3_SINWO
MSDSEDDYMSESFLKKIEDNRPGLVSKRTLREYKIEQQHKHAQVINRIKPKAELEKEHREKGLEKAISSDNKGFSMLQKMGFKPGMALGKLGTGRSEPIPLEVKTGRTGLGHEAEQKRKRDAKTARLSFLAEKRKKMERSSQQEFSQRQKERFDQKTAWLDLRKSQKVCEQLDSQSGITEPAECFFWPEALLPERMKPKVQSDLDIDEIDEGPSDQPGYSNYVVDVVEEEEEEEESEETEEDDDDKQPELSDTEKLEVLTLYLRNKHKYCVWCGTKFEDRKDMEVNCPGNTAEAHDD